MLGNDNPDFSRGYSHAQGEVIGARVIAEAQRASDIRARNQLAAQNRELASRLQDALDLLHDYGEENAALRHHLNEMVQACDGLRQSNDQMRALATKQQAEIYGLNLRIDGLVAGLPF